MSKSSLCFPDLESMISNRDFPNEDSRSLYFKVLHETKHINSLHKTILIDHKPLTEILLASLVVIGPMAVVSLLSCNISKSTSQRPP